MTVGSIVLTALTGILYPVAMTLAANVLFPAQANGSLIERDGQIVGSASIERAIEPPQFGVLGKPRVNVLRLNLAVDQMQ